MGCNRCHTYNVIVEAETQIERGKLKMNNFTDKLMEKIGPFAEAVSNNKYLCSLRDGFMVAFPATMSASIAIIIQYLPATFGLEGITPEWLLNFLNGFFGPIGNATMALGALFGVFGIAYSFAGHIKGNQLFSGIISMTSFLIMLPFGSGDAGAFIPIGYLGTQGMFIAIVTAFLATSIFTWLENKDFTIKMPAQVPPGIARSFLAIIPGAGTLLLFNIIRYIFTFTPYGNAFDCLYTILQQPLQSLGGSLPATLIGAALAQVFWWFGLHGQTLVGTFLEPLYGALNLENFTAFTAGQPLPNIICSTFMGIFPMQGGNGMTLGIVFLMLWLAKSARMKSTMKMVAAPAFFNISEPITFGLPIVMNPAIIIPWILAPVVSILIAYFCIYIGLCPRPLGITIVWTTPIFLSGILGTGSIMGAFVQLLCLIASTLIWFPFMKGLDNLYVKEEAEEEAEQAKEKEAACE